jgi:hypothetical protein
MPCSSSLCGQSEVGQPKLTVHTSADIFRSSAQIIDTFVVDLPGALSRWITCHVTNIHS